MKHAWPMALPVALALAACQPTSVTARGGAMVESRLTAPARVAPKITIAGQAQAPASLITNHGGGVIANQGGLVIANGGASVIANGGGAATGAKAGSFSLLAAEALAPAADAEVTLLAADGRPFPGVAPTKTDALGKFVLKGVPEGAVAFVEIKGQGFRLGRLMKASAEAVQVDPVSTAVADGMREKLKDPKELAQLKPAQLDALTAAVQAASDAGELTIDLKQGGNAAQALEKALAQRPEAAQAAQAAVAEARQAAAEAPPAADPAIPAQPGDQGPATPAEPATPANPAAGDAGQAGATHAAAGADNAAAAQTNNGGQANNGGQTGAGGPPTGAGQGGGNPPPAAGDHAPASPNPGGGASPNPNAGSGGGAPADPGKPADPGRSADPGKPADAGKPAEPGKGGKA